MNAIDPSRTTEAKSLEQWERTIATANVAFKQGQAGTDALYAEALEIALSVLRAGAWRSKPALTDRWSELDRTLAAVVVSYHNAAGACRRSGDQAQAADHYLAAHLAVCRLSVDVTVDDALRSLAVGHIARTLNALSGFKRACESTDTSSTGIVPTRH